MKELVAFSAIKTFYGTDKDLLDIVCDFVLLSISENVHNPIAIQEKIAGATGMNIPLDVIRSALKRLRNKYRLIECADGYSRVVLIESGVKEKNVLEATIEKSRKDQEGLIQDLREFFKKRNGLDVPIQTVKESLGKLIIHSPADIFQWMPAAPFPRTHVRALSLVADYILEQEKNASPHYAVLKSLIYGGVLASVLEGGKLEEGGKLQKLDVYLDSNLVFSLLELDHEAQNQVATEMLSVLKRIGATVKIFSFTLDEVRIKLSSYTGRHHGYVGEIEVDSIYYRIKAKGLDEAEVLLLIGNLEKSLGALGVTVDYVSGDVSLTEVDAMKISTLRQKKEERITLDGRFSPNRHSNHKHQATIEHDLLAIRAIKEIRKRSFSRIETSKAIFLTADAVLAKFNFEEYSHAADQTIPEVLFRTHLVSFLWLKSPELASGLPIKDLVSGYVAGRMVSEKLWDTFTWELRKQVEQGKYTSDDVATLISLKETKSLLIEIQEEGGSYEEGVRRKIIDSGLIEEAKKKTQENVVLKRYKKDAESILEEKTAQVEEINQRIVKIADNIAQSCTRFWKRSLTIALYALLIAVVALSVLSWFIYRFNPINMLVTIITIATSLGVVLGILFGFISALRREVTNPLTFIVKFVTHFENYLIQKCIDRKRKVFGVLN